MSRVQLALNVPDRDEAIAFYSKLFATEPAKVRDGYANFEIADPPLKLILFEASDGADRLNHLGVEVQTPDEVEEHRNRVSGELDVVDDNGTCCFAEQEKFWATAPDGTWEFYAVLADSETSGASKVIDADGNVSEEPICCAGA